MNAIADTPALPTSVELAMRDHIPGSWAPLTSQVSVLTQTTRQRLLSFQKASTISPEDAGWIGQVFRDLELQRNGVSASAVSADYFKVEMSQTGRTWAAIVSKYRLTGRGADAPAVPVAKAHQDVARLRQGAEEAARLANTAESAAFADQMALDSACSAVSSAQTALTTASTLAGQYKAELQHLTGNVTNLWAAGDLARDPTYQRITFLRTVVSDWPRVESMFAERLESAKEQFAGLQKTIETV